MGGRNQGIDLLLIPELSLRLAIAPQTNLSPSHSLPRFDFIRFASRSRSSASFAIDFLTEKSGNDECREVLTVQQLEQIFLFIIFFVLNFFFLFFCGLSSNFGVPVLKSYLQTNTKKKKKRKIKGKGRRNRKRNNTRKKEQGVIT